MNLLVLFIQFLVMIGYLMFPQYFKALLFRNPQIPVLSNSADRCVLVPQPKMLKPKKVLFRQNYMTSVLAVRQRAWLVFFIGTGDGQLIKVRTKKYAFNI